MQTLLTHAEKVAAPVLQINSADDFVNPPELGIVEQLMTRVKHGKFILLPITDQTVPALLQDLEQRGLLDETLVVWMGEFGRTPKINSQTSRDHWPQCYTTLLAGGGVKRGFVYGASDKNGAYPAKDPVRPDDLAATIVIYWGMFGEYQKDVLIHHLNFIGRLYLVPVALMLFVLALERRTLAIAVSNSSMVSGDLKAWAVKFNGTSWVDTSASPQSTMPMIIAAVMMQGYGRTST